MKWVSSTPCFLSKQTTLSADGRLYVFHKIRDALGVKYVTFSILSNDVPSTLLPTFKVVKYRFSSSFIDDSHLTYILPTRSQEARHIQSALEDKLPASVSF